MVAWSLRRHSLQNMKQTLYMGTTSCLSIHLCLKSHWPNCLLGFHEIRYRKNLQKVFKQVWVWLRVNFMKIGTVTVTCYWRHKCISTSNFHISWLILCGSVFKSPHSTAEQVWVSRKWVLWRRILLKTIKWIFVIFSTLVIQCG